MADNSQMKEILAKLDDGVKSLFESDKYTDYLRAMSRFHNYSTRNTLLIYNQYPEAHRVAGYNSWKNNFNRQVKKGEHGIKILAPIAIKNVQESAILDPVTRQPVIDEYGNAMMETVERTFARFRVVSVFDVNQTEGDPLPELAETLTGDVERYELFMDALRAVSPLPIHIEQMPPDTDGTCYFGDRIAIREGMSEIQTVSAVIHEMAHAKLHDRDSLAVDDKPKDKRTEEVEAESVSYVVCQKFGIETGANTFGYVGSWSKTQEMKELHASIDTIRKAASELIDGIEGTYLALAKERGIDLAAAPQRTAEIGTGQNYNMLDGVINNEPPKAESNPLIPGWEDIPQNDRDLVSNIQGYIQSYGRVMDISDYEIYQTVLKSREQSPDDAWVLTRYDDYGEYILNERTRLETSVPTQLTQVEQSREQLSALPQAETLDAKYDIAFAVLVDALCNNAELLALAGTGADWQRGAGRAAVFGGGYYETLIDALSAELADLLADTSMINRLRNTVTGEVYRRLDAIAYDRYILDEYADITKSGRLEVYLTPYPEESDNTGVLVHLTERLPDGNEHDYGEIFAYDPGDTRDHAINNYLTLKSFNELRESIFGKPETSVTLEFKETSPVGSTVLRPLLYIEGQFNRENKRTRVDVLPPMGKYSVYAQHLSGVIGDDTLIHAATDSGYLISLGVSKTRFDEQFFEAQIDRIFEKAPQQLEAQLAEPETFARYEVAAITGRIPEAEAHNVPVRKLREEQRRERREEAENAEKEEQRQKAEKYDTRVDEIAAAIGQNKTIAVGYNEYEFDGKNPVLDLFKLYGIELPLRTQGWVNTGLAEITESGYRYYSSKHKGNSTTFSGYLKRLRDAIKEVPIEVKRGRDSAQGATDGEKETLPESEEQRKVVGYLSFEDNGETIAYYSDEEMLAAYKREMSSLGADGVHYHDVADKSLEQKLYAAYANEYGEDISTQEKPVKEYSLGYGFMGNGITVWNHAEEQDGDYVTVAHIAADREVTYYDKDMPADVKAQIEHIAQTLDMTVSATQDTKVFSTDPKISYTLPDSSVTIDDMNAFGYTAIELLPLSKARAIELFNNGNPVYLLYPDNTESMVYDADEIKVHDGLCGIEVNDWERIQAAEIPHDAENSREADLLNNEPGMFGIYQIKDGIDEARNFRSAPMKELEAHGITPDRANYELVYTAPLTIHDTQTNLNRIYGVFQRDSPECPRDFTGRSVSLSDTLVLQWRGEVSSHYVDSAGFKELPVFTGEERQKPTYYQVENSTDKPAPTMAELEADVKAGKAISLLDLANAINDPPKRPPAQKGLPDLLGKIAANKQRVADAKKPAAPKDNQMEV